MTEIAQMQEQLEENLRKLQHQKEHRAGHAGPRLPGPGWEYQAHKAVYRLDPALLEAPPAGSGYTGYA